MNPRRPVVMTAHEDKFPRNPFSTNSTNSTSPTIHMSHLLALVLACSMFALLAPAIAQAEEASPSPAKASRVDPQALDLLKRMSTTLGEAKAFTYRSISIVEVPAKIGQFIALFSAAGRRAQTS